MAQVQILLPRVPLVGLNPIQPTADKWINRKSQLFDVIAQIPPVTTFPFPLHVTTPVFPWISVLANPLTILTNNQYIWPLYPYPKPASGTTYPVTLSDTLTLTDTLTKLTTKVLSETLTITDTLTKLTSKVYTETITLTDTLLKQAGKVLTETITLSDVLTPIKVAVVTLTETIVLSDTLTRLTSKVLLETLTLTDTVTKAMTRTFTETLTLTDTLLKLPGKVLSESITLTDSLIKQGQKVFSETLAYTDSLIKATTKVFTETLTISDVLTALKNGVAATYAANKQLLIDSINGLVTAIGTATLPTWNTSGRPTAPKTGTIGFNTETNKLEFYNGSAWKGIGLT